MLVLFVFWFEMRRSGKQGMEMARSTDLCGAPGGGNRRRVRPAGVAPDSVARCGFRQCRMLSCDLVALAGL